MPVDVSYEGVILARGAELRDTPGGLFVPLEPPMPVGTALDLGDGSSVRVTRVHEGVGSGVIVVAIAGRAPVAEKRVSAAQVPPAHVPAPVAADPEPVPPAPLAEPERPASAPPEAAASVEPSKPGDAVPDSIDPSEEQSGDRNGDPAKRGSRRSRRKPR